MMDFEDWLAYELCVPGGITGETDVDCPHCGVNLTVTVDDPDGEQAYTCCECSGEFLIDWADGTIRWQG
jgi:DNA-directed RNA polymerase subunit RPC12/RpoP